MNWMATLRRIIPTPPILRKHVTRWEVAAPTRRTLGIAVVTFVAPFFIVSAAGLRINCSPSLPLGLYKTTTESLAALIEFCPQEPYATFAARRGYRSTGKLHGRCGPADETRDCQRRRHCGGLGPRNCCEWVDTTQHRTEIEGQPGQSDEAMAVRSVSGSTGLRLGRVIL